MEGGRFELNADDGEIRFVKSLGPGGVPPPREELESLLICAFDALVQLRPALPTTPGA